MYAYIQILMYIYIFIYTYIHIYVYMYHYKKYTSIRAVVIDFLKLVEISLCSDSGLSELR